MLFRPSQGLSLSQKNRMSSDPFRAPSASNLIIELLEVRRLIVNFHSSSFRAHTLSSFSSFVILSCLYVLWMHGLKVVQPCQALIWFSKAIYSCWVGSRQSNPVESLSGAQGSPALPSSQSFQKRSKRIYTLGPIVPGNLQRPKPSSLALLVSDLRHLVSTPWPILITRLTTAQGKRSGCVQPTGYSSPLSDARGWSNLMPQQMNNLQIDTRAEYPSGSYINALPTLWRRRWGVECVRWGKTKYVGQEGTWGSKWESDLMRRCDGGQADQSEVLGNCLRPGGKNPYKALSPSRGPPRYT